MVAAGSILIGGCGSGRAVAPTPLVRDTNLQEPTVERSVDFGGRPILGERRASSIIGIYGEEVSQSSVTPGFGDGSHNLAQITFAAEGDDFDPDVDPNGEWIYFASTQHRATSELYRKPIGGSTVTQLTSDPADDMMPEVSPDGAQIAFCSNRSGNWDIYIMPSSGGSPRLITSDPANEIHPSWSPDGRRLVYSKYNDLNGRWELWAVNVDNVSVRHFIDYGLMPEWSPDPARSKILFQRAKERGSRYHSIWTIDLVDNQGRNPTEIVSSSNAAIINPAWSPDGEHIVFVTVLAPESQPGDTPAVSDVWIVALDGTGRVNLTQGDFANFQPTWGGDGRIYFVSDRGGSDNLWTVDASSVVGRTGGTVANAPDEAGN